MSNLYNLEPQPTAKVIVHTTSGDLTLELFAKQTPLASRNFLQHCLDGYYDNTIFHRLVPGFIVQGGDPTGTGSGGISAVNNGEPFPDEFHSRLKFNRRGLLGSANEGKDSNGSQFFITLGVTPELQGKHTMFGRIEGDTIYNLMKIGDAELVEGEGSDRPMYPTKVTSTEILVNPFEDMVARVKTAPRVQESSSRAEVKKRKKPLGKNVLSFGDDETDEMAIVVPSKKSKVNPKLVDISEKTDTATRVEKPQGSATTLPPKFIRDDNPEPKMKPDLDDQRRTSQANRPKSISSNEDEDEDEDEVADRADELREEKRLKELERTNEQIAALKASMRRDVGTNHKELEKPRSTLEGMIPATSTRGRRRGKETDEKGAMDLFKAFKSRLEEMPAAAEDDVKMGEAANGVDATKGANIDEDEEAALCDLHFIANCQSCKAWDEDDANDRDTAGEDDGGAWMTHRLTFIKDTLGKDLEWKRKMAQIEVIDPREKAKNISEERKKTQKARPR